jgi:hypothetical protein
MMNWLLPIAAYLIFGVLAFWVVVSVLVRWTGGDAPNCRLHCTHCGHTGDAGKAGLIRLGAISSGKRTLGICRRCKRLRWLSIERVTYSS